MACHRCSRTRSHRCMSCGCSPHFVQSCACSRRSDASGAAAQHAAVPHPQAGESQTVRPASTCSESSSDSKLRGEKAAWTRTRPACSSPAILPIEIEAAPHLVFLATTALVPHNAAKGADLSGAGRAVDGTVDSRLSFQQKRDGAARVGTVAAKLVGYAGFSLNLHRPAQHTQRAMISAAAGRHLTTQPTYIYSSTSVKLVDPLIKPACTWTHHRQSLPATGCILGGRWPRHIQGRGTSPDKPCF